MKTERSAFIPLLAALAICLLTGCKPSEPGDPPAPSPEPVADAPAVTPPSAPTPTAANVPKPSILPPLPTVPALPPSAQAAARFASQYSSQLAASETVKSDPVLQEISGDISTRIEALGDAVKDEQKVQSVLTETLSALTKGRDADAIAAYNKIAAAKLTPEQTAIAGTVKDALLAFVAQRNFSSLAGAQGEVGQLVAALRGGDAPTALQSLKDISSKAQLTPDQKSLINSIAASSSPLADKAADAIKNLNPFGN